MAGRATLTMLKSKTTMNDATSTRASAHGVKPPPGDTSPVVLPGRAAGSGGGDGARTADLAAPARQARAGRSIRVPDTGMGPHLPIIEY